MHIALISPEYVTPRQPEGGLANYVRKIGVALTARGHRVRVFVPADGNRTWADGPLNVHETRQLGLADNGRGWQFRPLVRQVWSARRLARAVWRLHRVDPIDIIQASSYLAPGHGLLHNGRVPVVCRVSSYSPLLSAANGRRRRLREYLSDWLELRQVLDADACFAPSRLMADVFSRFEGVSPAVIRSPLPAMDVSLDASFYEQHLKGLRYLLYFAALNRIKGADLVGQAAPAILERFHDCHVVFVGRSPSKGPGRTMFDEIRDGCDRFRERLLHFDVLPREKLYPVIAGARGVLMPSRVDNYPNACLEAQCLGVPVVGTRGSSLDEMIVDGETGFLAENGSADSLTDAVVRLLSMRGGAMDRMQANISAGVAHAGQEDRVGQLVAYFERVISRFSPSG